MVRIITCTRKLEFDYGHRLMNHESKCAHTHGHRGVAEITCSAESLDRAGRVIDFGDIKKIVGTWLDENWDHAFIFNEADAPIRTFLVNENQRRFQFPTEPSAENLAAFLGEKAQELLRPRGIRVVHVRLYETPNGYADWYTDNSDLD